MFVLIATVFLLIIHQGECAMTATADLYGNNSTMLYGTLTFTQYDADTAVRITGSIIGLNTTTNAHGFHIHTYPVEEIEPNCTAAGGHFNPYNAPHGPPTASITERHVGDLGNITGNEDGDIVLDMDDSIIQLYNATQSIINRTVVVHLYRDDGGQGGFPDSATTGNAGARIICGLIILTSEDPTTTTSVSTTSIPDHNTTWSVGLNIQPTMFVLIITMIVGYIIRY